MSRAPDPADYAVTFDAAQWQRLLAAFPNGVCDWSQPGTGQVPSRPWVTYAAGPGGEALGTSPASVPLPEPGVMLGRALDALALAALRPGRRHSAS